MSEQTLEAVVPEWELSDRLRKALTHAGISSTEMAEYLEVTRHTISNWINGHTRPRPAELKMWALRTGVDYRWLVSGLQRPGPDDFGPPAPSLTSDIPGGISHDHDEPRLTQAEVLAYRKRIPLSPTDQAELILTSAAPARWRAAA